MSRSRTMKNQRYQHLYYSSKNWTRNRIHWRESNCHALVSIGNFFLWSGKLFWGTGGMVTSDLPYFPYKWNQSLNFGMQSNGLNHLLNVLIYPRKVLPSTFRVELQPYGVFLTSDGKEYIKSGTVSQMFTLNYMRWLMYHKMSVAFSWGVGAFLVQLSLSSNYTLSKYLSYEGKPLLPNCKFTRKTEQIPFSILK